MRRAASCPGTVRWSPRGAATSLSPGCFSGEARGGGAQEQGAAGGAVRLRLQVRRLPDPRLCYDDGSRAISMEMYDMV